LEKHRKWRGLSGRTGIKEELADRQGKISRCFLPEGIVQGSGMQQGEGGKGITHVFLVEVDEWQKWRGKVRMK
jgi:hypothetical protein